MGCEGTLRRFPADISSGSVVLSIFMASKASRPVPFKIRSAADAYKRLERGVDRFGRQSGPDTKLAHLAQGERR